MIGNRVDLTQGNGEYIYEIQPSYAEDMMKIFDESVKLFSTDSGTKFSHVVGMCNVDILEKNDLGFTRCMDINGEQFTVKFLYAHEQLKKVA